MIDGLCIFFSYLKPLIECTWKRDLSLGTDKSHKTRIQFNLHWRGEDLLAFATSIVSKGKEPCANASCSEQEPLSGQSSGLLAVDETTPSSRPTLTFSIVIFSPQIMPLSFLISHVWDNFTQLLTCRKPGTNAPTPRPTTSTKPFSPTSPMPPAHFELFPLLPFEIRSQI